MLSVNQSLAAIAKSTAEIDTQMMRLAKRNEPARWSDISGWLWRSQEQEEAALIKNCHSLLNRIERQPVTFHTVPDAACAQNACHLAGLKTTIAAYTILSTEKKVSCQLAKLMQKIVALQYRLEQENGGINRKPADPLLYSQLCDKALHWKRSSPLSVEKDLNPKELQQLQEAASYPEFARLLLASREIQKSFFTWALRDANGVSQFVQFPSVCAKMKSAFLASRTGRLGAEMLRLEKVSEGDVQKKTLSLPFHVQNRVEYVNILDESKEVELANGWRLKISDIFDIFAKKNREVGDLEFFASTGITNWNCHQLGSWNPVTKSYERIDLTKKEWWLQLPRLEVVSRETLAKRLNEPLNPEEWVVCAKAARTTPDLDLDVRHGYFEVAIPVESDKYVLCPFGKLAGVFPNSLLELIGFLGDTVAAKVAYPDENFFYSQRQQAVHPIKLTAEQGYNLMHILQKELIKAKYGHIIFQFGGENCAFWSQGVLHDAQKDLPNFYRLNFLESMPLNPVLKGIFSGIRALPERFQMYGIIAFDRLFGSHRGKRVVENGRWVYKTHHTSAPRNEWIIYQPGLLHRLIEQGQLKGFLSFGNSGL